MPKAGNHDITILTGDCRKLLKTLPDESVHCCITSPPYWGLRDYGHPDQIGQEPTPEQYVGAMRSVFAEVRRVLRNDGTLWLNLSDSYYGSWGNYAAPDGRAKARDKHRADRYGTFRPPMAQGSGSNGLKPKDLCGIPWRVALALQADGWYLRSDIIWHKPNPMPESVKDRPTRAHEYLFLFSKSRRYYYDAVAIKEPPSASFLKELESGCRGHATKPFSESRAQDAFLAKRHIIEAFRQRLDKQRDYGRRHAGFNERWKRLTMEERRLCGVNKRSVWTVPTSGYRGAHTATYPPALIRPCLLAGCPCGGLVLDPFAGTGTTGMVAQELGRRALLLELNPEYVKLIERRCNGSTPPVARA
jgi:DNA modification methylase